MADSQQPRILVAFPSSLGWMALITSGDVVAQLTFGHTSAGAATQALDPRLLEGSVDGTSGGTLIRRLKAYASGHPVDFRDVQVDLEQLTRFQCRVAHHCRQIPYGQTLTYGQLAAKARSPRAARAVGQCMAANRVPLIIPCHRVVPASGRPGGFSAPGGSETKRRLLALEAAPLP